MPNEIELVGLKEMIESGGVQLIEVLPEKEYAEEHVSGAINIPLKSMNPESGGHLDRGAPTVVYCWDDI